MNAHFPPVVTIGTRKVSTSDPLYIIAEIGTAHGGDRVKAQELIQAVKESGADCAKFQVVIAREILHPLTGTVPLPGGDIPLYDRFLALEQSPDFYHFLKEETEKAGLDFLASPFGEESARILRDLDCKAFKVASPELNHEPLLRQLAGYGKPLILSSGVSKLAEIERARELTEGVPSALLHCITSYPAPEEEYNLRVLPALTTLLGLPVGISDHSLDPLAVPLAGLLQGAALLEKHICLDRKADGLDDPIALDPSDFKRMTGALRKTETLSPPDREPHVRELLGSQRLEAILGTGRKRLAPSEAANYSRTNRSLHVLKDLPRYHVLKPEDLGILRTEKVLRPGISPGYLNLVLGRRLTREVEAGQGLVWEDLLTD